MTPKLPGATRVIFRLSNPTYADLANELKAIERSWAKASSDCHRVGWGAVMRGVEVMLLDHAPYTARCWDDNRVWIHVRKLASDPEPAPVLVHEFGHRLWFQCLTDAQRDDWYRGWQQGKRDGTLISDYAATDEIEDFAEVFRALVYHKLDALNRARWRRMNPQPRVVGACVPGTAHPSASFVRSRRRSGNVGRRGGCW